MRFPLAHINCTAYKHLPKTINCIHSQKMDFGIVAIIFCTAGLHFTGLLVERLMW